MMTIVERLDQVSAAAYNELKAHWDRTGEREIPPYELAPLELAEMTLNSYLRYLRVWPVRITPEVSQALWVADAYNRGWRAGRVFDLSARTDPRMREFRQLSDSEKIISDIMVSTFREHQGLLLPDTEEDFF